MNLFESTFEKHTELATKAQTQQTGAVSNEFKREFWDDFNEMSVSEFVSKYGQIARDTKVKAFLTAGNADGDNSENFRVKKGVTTVGKLIPTQNEIGFKNSLNDLCSINYPAVPRELDIILTGDNVILGAPSIKEVPIIIFAGKYIIDGHHRWSKIACCNPLAKVVCLDFNNKMLQNDPEKALKAFHLAIAQYQNEMPTEEKSGANLFNSTTEDVHKYVKAGLSNPKSAPLVEIYNKHKSKIVTGEAKPNAGQIANYIARNAGVTVIGKTPATDTARKYMPQLDKAPAAIISLEKGAINFSPDKVTESLFESTFNKFKNLYTK